MSEGNGVNEEEIEEIIEQKVQERVEKQLQEKLNQETKTSESTQENEEKQGMTRRDFLKKTGMGAAALGAIGLTPASSRILLNDPDGVELGGTKMITDVDKISGESLASTTAPGGGGGGPSPGGGGDSYIGNSGPHTAGGNLDMKGNDIKNIGNINTGGAASSLVMESGSSNESTLTLSRSYDEYVAMVNSRGGGSSYITTKASNYIEVNSSGDYNYVAIGKKTNSIGGGDAGFTITYPELKDQVANDFDAFLSRPDEEREAVFTDSRAALIIMSNKEAMRKLVKDGYDLVGSRGNPDVDSNDTPTLMKYQLPNPQPSINWGADNNLSMSAFYIQDCDGDYDSENIARVVTREPLDFSKIEKVNFDWQFNYNIDSEDAGDGVSDVLVRVYAGGQIFSYTDVHDNAYGGRSGTAFDEIEEIDVSEVNSTVPMKIEIKAYANCGGDVDHKGTIKIDNLWLETN